MDGAEIRGLRKQMDLTQEQFAHEIGVTFATVNRWENNKSKPSRLALKALNELRQKNQGSSRGRGKRSRRKR
ncbi:MAG: helix-turn-helix domain-containing protein [Planctomycetota bacterium]